jgi:hypothetical protein
MHEKKRQGEEMIASSTTAFQASTEDNHLEEDIPLCLKGVSREEMEIVFLGTGSSQPSKYRNVSAIYVHLFKQGGIMLDCGEGTYAQLTRRCSVSVSVSCLCVYGVCSSFSVHFWLICQYLVDMSERIIV